MEIYQYYPPHQRYCKVYPKYHLLRWHLEISRGHNTKKQTLDQLVDTKVSRAAPTSVHKTEMPTRATQ